MATIGMLKIGMSVNTGGATKSIRSVSDELDRFKAKGGSSGGGSSILAFFSQIGLAAIALKGIIGGISNVVGGPLKLAADAEQTAISFKVMLGSADEANRVLKDMRTFAAATPFEFPELANAGKQLLAFGVAGDQLVPTMKKLGDISAGLAIPLQDIAYLYGTTRVQGRLYTQDLNQFTSRGIPLMAELAKQFGVQESEVKKLVETGKVGFPEVEKAINSLTGEGGKFAGLMEAQSQSVAGVWSTLKDNFGTAMTEIGAAIIETFDLKNAVTGMSGMIENVMPMIRNFLKQFKEVFDFMKPIAIQVINVIVARFTILWESIVWVADQVRSLFSGSWMPSWEQMRDFVLDALIMLEFAIKNWKTVLEVAAKGALLAIVKFANEVHHTFTVRIPAVLVWLADNWRDVLFTMFDYATTVWINLASNIVKIISNIPALLKGTTSFNELWTPLTEGAYNALKSLPDIPERELGNFEKALQDDLKRIGTQKLDEFVKFQDMRKAQLLPPTVKKELTTATDKVKSLNDEITKTGEIEPKKPKLASAAELGSKEARDSIIRHRFGSNDPMKNIEKIEKEHLEVAKKHDKKLDKIADNAKPAILTF